MFAIALAEAARRTGKSPLIVLAHNAQDDEQLGGGTFHLYHVAIEVDGVLIDARGRIARDEDVLSFMNPRPEAKIERFVLDNDVKGVIRRNTKWDKSFEKYAREAERVLASLKILPARR